MESNGKKLLIPSSKGCYRSDKEESSCNVETLTMERFFGYSGKVVQEKERPLVPSRVSPKVMQELVFGSVRPLEVPWLTAVHKRFLW
jgi:hypothetical protein